MNFMEYSSKVLKTESKVNDVFCERIKALGWNESLEFGVLGIVSEKKELELGLKKEDNVNLIEEIGDILWYIALISRELEIIEDVNYLIESILEKFVEKSRDMKEIGEFLSFEREYISKINNFFRKRKKELLEIETEDICIADISRRIKFYYVEVNEENKKRVLKHKKEIELFIYEMLSGDLFFLLKNLNSSFEEAMTKNILKLEKRYPKGTFSQEDAVIRNLEEERKVLEGEDND